jgi:membrane-bound lytic murein transglycosylase B
LIIIFYEVLIYPATAKYNFLAIDLSEDKINLIEEIDNKLNEAGITDSWFLDNVKNSTFKLYPQMEKYFNNMAESKVERKEVDFEWYKNHFGLDEKITNGKIFINNNLELLQKIENRNGIDKNLIVSIIGLETNYAEKTQLGNFYVFNSLISQYIFNKNRKKFAVNQLFYLYKFSTKINKKVDYFIGSFAGACGWAQFIPFSLSYFFIDTNGIDKDTDIYAVDDCLTSIENYLFLNGLNKENINDEKELYKAIYSYNHSDPYVKAILYVYYGLKEK